MCLSLFRPNTVYIKPPKNRVKNTAEFLISTPMRDCTSFYIYMTPSYTSLSLHIPSIYLSPCVSRRFLYVSLSLCVPNPNAVTNSNCSPTISLSLHILSIYLSPCVSRRFLYVSLFLCVPNPNAVTNSNCSPTISLTHRDGDIVGQGHIQMGIYWDRDTQGQPPFHAFFLWNLSVPISIRGNPWLRNTPRL